MASRSRRVPQARVAPSVAPGGYLPSGTDGLSCSCGGFARLVYARTCSLCATGGPQEVFLYSSRLLPDGVSSVETDTVLKERSSLALWPQHPPTG